ncbi:pilus assembly protein [Bradyrhizobium sp. LTSPM299]|uniref:Flp family type IVb pilin n=1 Tax=unclassified Bradyrhizobium TaxID=2631580 RepID=UPI0005C80EF8|nr:MULTISPECIES: Flp family type IVb pilin [unclassified Bradyrhizobium]KJC49448.1 pilus assembly protein [Bradyrhizobium sp. LTSP885]KJC62730.1 pilus assembly protein [Bradyrhizobium sp. LTSPM299]
MRSLLARFFRDESGTTALEYAIIGGGLSIIIVYAVGGIGTNLSARFASVSTSLK